MKLLVGLGNVGTPYAKTRHNIGFMVSDQIAANTQAHWTTESKLKAAVATVNLGDTKVILAKPHTMMNLSGDSIQRIMQFYKIAGSDVWVVFDDIDVPFGRMRVRMAGASGGHQGVNSTIQHIGPEFVRVRMGISLNDRAVEPSEIYVLKPFNPEERETLPHVISAAADKISQLLQQGAPDETTFLLA